MTRSDRRMFDFLPLKGVPPVLLGMSQEEVLIALGMSYHHRPAYMYSATVRVPAIDYFYDSCFQVVYSDCGVVECVEFVCVSLEDKIGAMLFGMDVFATPAAELVELISEQSAFDKDNPQLGYTYIFPELGLLLGRETMPDDEDDEDGRYFETIAVALPGFWKK